MNALAGARRGGCSSPGDGPFRIPILAFLAATVALSLPSPAFAWGAKMHEIINRRAAESLPGEAGEAWGPLAVDLGRHASDADHRKSTVPGEPPRHFIDIDAYEPAPFTNVPHTLEGVRKKYGAESPSRWGTVPWAIEECYEMVVLSLRAGDWASAGAWGADLGHYVADSHQPLHCTVNYDGQSTGNDGVHLRFEVTMMDRYFEESTIGVDSTVAVVDSPVDFCFGWIAQAYEGIDALLDADSRATLADSSFGDTYYEALWDGTRDVATVQMNRAVRDLARLYASAWHAAGRPSPPTAVGSFRALPVAVLKPPPARSRTAPAAFVVAGLAVAGAILLGTL